jgi:hypothetical protein
MQSEGKWHGSAMLFFFGVPPNMLDIKFRGLMVLYQLFQIIPCKCITLDFEKNIFFQVPFLCIMTLRRGFAFVNALRKLSSLLMGNKSWSLGSMYETIALRIAFIILWYCPLLVQINFYVSVRLIRQIENFLWITIKLIDYVVNSKSVFVHGI